MTELLPLFLNLSRRRVLVVGAGPVAAAKLQALVATGADVTVVAPAIDPAIERAGVHVERRAFAPGDLEGVWLVVAAATPEVNRAVSAAAEARRIFVNAVDDPANASAYLSGVVRRDGVTVAISTSGEAPALAGLLREALDAVLPEELDVWLDESRRQRRNWRRDRVPMAARRPMLLDALNDLYGRSEDLRYDPGVDRLYDRGVDLPSDPGADLPSDRAVRQSSVVARDHYAGVAQDRVVVAQDHYAGVAQDHRAVVAQDRYAGVAQDFSPAVRVPWMSAPEDSWM